MNVSASLYSQNKTVSLKLTGATLEEVIQSLKLQTDYGFFYNIDNKDVKSVKNITIDVKDMALEDVLLKVLKGTNLAYSIVNNVVILNTKDPVVARDTVKKEYVLVGKVLDDKNAPLPGVTVRLQNTTVGTATDVKGIFTFRLPVQKGSVVLSFVGFKKKEVSFRMPCDTLRIVLEEDLANLDEVTVVAYGERKKREVVGAISSVKADDIKEVPSASLENLLQGRMAGVEINTQSGAPGGGGSVVAIRGYNSLFIGDGRDYGEPLYVIDGVPVYSFTSPITGTNALAEIDPSTIESVEVLKDAASAAIYGSRAGNGVILITTKKGRAGNASFSANVSYSYSILPETPLQTGGRAERAFNFLKIKNLRTAGWSSSAGTVVYPGSYIEAVEDFSEYDGWWTIASSAREVRRVGEFVSFRENVFDSEIGSFSGCDGEYLVKLSLRHAEVPANGHVSAQHRFDTLAQCGDDRYRSQFPFFVCQYITLEKVGEKMLLEETFDDGCELGIPGFGRIGRHA